MIFNPVVNVETGGGNTFSISGSFAGIFPSSAKAGEIVLSTRQDGPSGFDIFDEAENRIPYTTTQTPLTRAVADFYYYFVMPASNVVITEK